jgi:uncharacterized membrane protein
VLASETALAAFRDGARYPELEAVRRELSEWRLYHDFRTDAGSPIRQPCHAITTPTLSADGHDLAAVLATLSGLNDGAVRAIVALAVMNTIQTVVHGGYLAAREPKQIRLAFEHWRSSWIVGVLSVCGSACWAWAFALQNAARVRTFGQIELVVTFAVAHWWLRERHTRREYTGTALVLAGVVGVMLAG